MTLYEIMMTVLAIIIAVELLMYTVALIRDTKETKRLEDGIKKTMAKLEEMENDESGNISGNGSD